MATRLNEIPRHRAVLDFSPSESPARTIEKLNEMIRQFDNRINDIDSSFVSLNETVENLDFTDILASVNSKIDKLKSYVTGFVPPHLHDGQVLQNDGINSDGGAFAFTTTGAVTFSQPITVTGNISVGGSNNELRFYEGANYVGFEAPALAADQIWVLPAADGAPGTFLQTNGAGALTWAAVAPGGANTNVQFNNAGALGGSANFTWDGSNLRASTSASTVSAASYFAINNAKVFDVTTGTGSMLLGLSSGVGYTGTRGIGIGYNTLGSNGAGCSGNDNIAAGYACLQNCTTGYNNTAIGNYALSRLTVGYGNFAGGYACMQNCLGGYLNTGFGSQCMGSLTNGSNNAAVGNSALTTITTAVQCAAFGANALQYNTANSGSAFGAYAGERNSAGLSNCYFGQQNGRYQQAGSYNSFYGAQSGRSTANYTVSNASGFGYQSLYTGCGNGCIAVGYMAGYYETNSNRLYITNQQGANLATGLAAAIIYGVMSSTTADQDLYFHAETFVETANANAFIVRDAAYSKCDGLVRKKTTEVQTLNAVQTTVDSITLLDENTYHVEAYVVGVENGGGNRASYHITGTFYRTGAGVATQQGITTTIHSQESNAAWDATFTVNGNDVRVSVTGAAATTIEWVTTIHFINMSD